MKYMIYKPKITSQRYKLHKCLIPVREDEVELESGNRLKYMVLEYHNAVASVALTSDNKILLVQVPRYPIAEYLWELPGGKLEPEELPEKCALRELEEETGYKANHIEELIAYYPEPSFSTEKLYIFLATELSRSGTAVTEREGFAKVKLFSFDDALKMVFDGRIKSSWSMIGILFASSKLKCRHQI